MEIDGEVALAVLLQREDVAAEGLSVSREASQPSTELLGEVALRSHALAHDPPGPGVPVFGEEDGQGLAVLSDQVQPVLDAREMLVGGQRDVDVLDWPLVEV